MLLRQEPPAGFCGREDRERKGRREERTKGRKTAEKIGKE